MVVEFANIKINTGSIKSEGHNVKWVTVCNKISFILMILTWSKGDNLVPETGRESLSK